MRRKTISIHNFKLLRCKTQQNLQKTPRTKMEPSELTSYIHNPLIFLYSNKEQLEFGI
jgi:hypothetical protein